MPRRLARALGLVVLPLLLGLLASTVHGSGFSGSGGAGVTWPLTATGTAATNYFTSPDGSSSPVSAATSGSLRYNNTTGTWQVSTQGGAWTSLATSAGTTLQSAYAAGATIAEAGGVPVAVSSTTADNSAVMTLTKNPGGAQSGDVLDITLGATTTGAGVNISQANGGTGNLSTWTWNGSTVAQIEGGGTLAGQLRFENTAASVHVDGHNCVLKFHGDSGVTVEAGGSNPCLVNCSFLSPFSTNAFDLGSGSLVWRHEFLNDLQLAGSGSASSFIESTDQGTVAVSGGATGRIRYNNAGSGNWQVSTQGGAYVNLATGASSTTLAQAYTNGGAGGGAFSLTSSGGPLALTAPKNSFVVGLTIAQQSNGTDAMTVSGGSISCPGSGTSSERFGDAAVTLGSNTSAFGQGASASTTNCSAFGASASSAGSNAVALGKSASAFGTNTTSVGTSASAGGNNSTVIGEAASDGNFASCTILGTGASSAGAAGSNVVIGASATSSGGGSSTVVGTSSSDGGFTATVLGQGLTATAANQVMIGGFLYFGSGSTATRFLESPDGSTAAVSGGATGRIRYNNSTGKWEASTQGGAYSAFATGSTTLAQAYTAGGASGGAFSLTSSGGPLAITAPLNAFVGALTLTENNTGQTALLVTSQGSGISCPGSGSLCERFGSGADTGTASGASAFGNTAVATATGSAVFGRNSTASGVVSCVFGSGSSDGGFADVCALGNGITATAADRTILRASTALTWNAQDAGISEISSNVIGFGSGVQGQIGGTVSSAQHAFGVHASVSTSQTLDQTATFWPATGNTTLQLPKASGLAGVIYSIKKTDAAGTTITVAPTVGDTIDSGASVTLTSQNQSFDFISDGVAHWWIK